MVTIDDVPSHETVIKMQRIRFNMFCKFLEIFSIAMNISEENNIYLLHSYVEFYIASPHKI